MLRLGLVCKFKQVPIKFRSTTAISLLKMDRQDALAKVAYRIRENAAALKGAVAYCAANDIGSFRITSEILPLKTHPQAGYEVEELPGAEEIVERFRECGRYARERNVRLVFHPGQFTLLSSPDPGVIERSVADIEYHALVAEWVGADVINIHGGGGYGNKEEALARMRANLNRLSGGARRRLTLENDDKVYTPRDLLPVCRAEGIPFVYDVHHHRVLADGMAVEAVTAQALTTWEQEPLFHISTPREGWSTSRPAAHHDYVNPADFPSSWMQVAAERNLTVEVEAKAKEFAVLALLHSLKPRLDGKLDPN